MFRQQARPFNKPPALVLDTNAVLDWLVFDDPGMRWVADQIRDDVVHWLACPAMRDELAQVLAHKPLAGRRPDQAAVLAQFDRWARTCAQPARSADPHWQCSDPDDQVFLDLARAQGARWLLSHDRALHRLARRARAGGLLILRPAALKSLDAA